jgi:hypothetical protein
MPQFILNSNEKLITRDDIPIITKLDRNTDSLAVSADGLNVYSSSGLSQSVTKHSFINGAWVKDDAFKTNMRTVIANDIPYPTGLAVSGTTLIIAFCNSENVSRIVAVNALTGAKIFDRTTGKDLSSLSSTTTGSAAIYADTEYLYVASTKNNNYGNSLDRVQLPTETARSVTTRDFIKNLSPAPIQIQKYGSYLCVLQAGLARGQKFISFYNLNALRSNNLADARIQLNNTENINVGMFINDTYLSVVTLVNNVATTIFNFNLFELMEKSPITSLPLSGTPPFNATITGTTPATLTLTLVNSPDAVTIKGTVYNLASNSVLAAAAAAAAATPA